MSDRDDYVAGIKSAFVTMGDKAVEGILTAYFPFLAMPILSDVLDFIVNKVMTDLVDEGEVAAFFEYIDFRVNAQGRAFSEAAIKNHQVQLSGTPEEKALAKKDLWEKFLIFAPIVT